MRKDEFETFLSKLLKNKAMLSSDIKKAILKQFQDENINTIKSMILRSKILRSSFPVTFDNGCYAYTLKSNRNYEKLFLQLSNDDTDIIRFIKDVLDEKNSFVSLFTFKKLLQIKPGNEKLIKTKLDVLRFYKDTITLNENYILPISEMKIVDHSSEFYDRQRARLLAGKILLYKHNAENLIQISKANFLGTTNRHFYFPKPLFNIYFDAYAHSPSYIKNTHTMSYVVYDFAICDSYSAAECKSFIGRITKLKAYGVAIIPICVYKTIKPEVKDLLKSSGLIGIQYSSFLGKDHDDILSKLNKINLDDDLNFTCDNFKSLVDSLKQIDLLEQTKGYLFEYVCYRFLNDYYGVKPERNVVVPKTGDKQGAQFDIVISLDSEIIICECKATSAGIGFGSMEKANKYSIAHTIDKMLLLKKTNKKLLYFTTSYYKKISKENGLIISKFIPKKSLIKNECLYTFNDLISAFSENEWLIAWKNSV